jgi:8-oxo-dGTP diphosphatase
VTGGHEVRVVVGAAIVRDGRLLAARRRYPAALAGRWEFPGGKVETDESDRDALVRECREELGVTINCGEPIGGDWPIGAAMVLRVFWAQIGADEPFVVADHDELRWLAADELFDVDWLPADLPAVAALGAHLRA